MGIVVYVPLFWVSQDLHPKPVSGFGFRGYPDVNERPQEPCHVGSSLK